MHLSCDGREAYLAMLALAQPEKTLDNINKDSYQHFMKLSILHVSNANVTKPFDIFGVQETGGKSKMELSSMSCSFTST